MTEEYNPNISRVRISVPARNRLKSKAALLGVPVFDFFEMLSNTPIKEIKEMLIKNNLLKK